MTCVGEKLRQIDAILSFVQDVSGPWHVLIPISVPYHTYMICICVYMYIAYNPAQSYLALTWYGHT